MKRPDLRLMGAPVFLPPLNTAPQKLAILGDSISGQNTLVSGAFTYLEAYGYAVTLNILSRNRYYFEHPYNKGVSGDITAQILARVGTVPSDSTVVAVLGGTNDIVGAVSASTIQNNLRSIYDSLIGSGKRVVAIKILPRTWPGGWTQGQIDTAEGTRAAVNAWIGAQRDVIAINAEAAFAPGGTLDATLFTDGIHPSIKGAYVLGQEMNKVLRKYYGMGLPLDPSTGNLLTSGGDMSGTGGTVSNYFTGTLADGWTISGGTAGVGTRTVSKNADGSQKISISIPAGSALQTSELRYTANVTSGYAAGDKLVAEMDFEVLNSANIHWMGLELKDVAGTTNTFIGYDKESNPIPASMGRGIIKTPEAVIQSGSTRLEMRLKFQYTPTAGAASTLDLNIYGAKVRKVP